MIRIGVYSGSRNPCDVEGCEKTKTRIVKGLGEMPERTDGLVVKVNFDVTRVVNIIEAGPAQRAEFRICKDCLEKMFNTISKNKHKTKVKETQRILVR